MELFSNFLLGAATAAHQVEGNNTNSDFWAQELMTHTVFAEPSGTACEHYERYEQDIQLLAEAGMNAYRFSIEWARIEPEEGIFDDTEVEHYRDVVRCCKRYGLTPVVTMHHFSCPVWVIAKGGWEVESVIQDFTAYCVYVMQRLGSELEYICTINEVNMGLQVALFAEKFAKRKAKYGKTIAEAAVQVGMNAESLENVNHARRQEHKAIFGVEEPQTFLVSRSEYGDQIVARAHASARDAMKTLCPHLKIGMTLSLHAFQPLPGGEQRAQYEWDREFRHYLPYIERDDFLGVQNYTRALVDVDGWTDGPEGVEKTQMHYEFYPAALAQVIRDVAKDFHGELLVTEHGVAVADDTRRVYFIEEAMKGVKDCIKDGIPVKGYFYWSLLDNFEWQKGYALTFGLIAVDRVTQKRMPKPSLYHLGSYRDRM